MSNKASNVSVGKPKKAGAIHVAPIGAEVPTNATSELNEAYSGLGYISEDGITNSNSAQYSDVKAWGGDTVLSLQEDKKDTFQFTMIEALNINVLKTVYGDTNVTGDLSTGITIKANMEEQEEKVFVIDQILRGNVLKRIVIPRGKVTAVGDIIYKGNQVIGYPTTITAAQDEAGQSHYEYVYGGNANSQQSDDQQNEEDEEQ